MNIALWLLQALIAFHTATGAVWKLSNSEQTVPSLGAIPHTAWLGLAAAELLCSVALVLPALDSRLAPLAPAASAVIALEMLGFVAVHQRSGDGNRGPMVYWLVVAVLCAMLVAGRTLTLPG